MLYKAKHSEGKPVTGLKISEKAMFLYYEMKITGLPVKNSDQYWYLSGPMYAGLKEFYYMSLVCQYKATN